MWIREGERPPHLQPLQAVQDLVLGCGNVVAWILRQVAGQAQQRSSLMRR